jgi:hypothetical protein
VGIQVSFKATRGDLASLSLEIATKFDVMIVDEWSTVPAVKLCPFAEWIVSDHGYGGFLIRPKDVNRIALLIHSDRRLLSSRQETPPRTEYAVGVSTFPQLCSIKLPSQNWSERA